MAEEKTKVEENVNTEENTSPKASEEENQEESSEEQSVQDYVPGVDRPAKTYEEVAKEMSKKKGDSSFSIKGLKDKVADSGAWDAVKNTVGKAPKVLKVAAGAWGAAYLTDRFLDGKEQRGDNVDETTFVSRGKEFFSNNFDDEKAFVSRGKAFVSEKFDNGKDFLSDKFDDGKAFVSEKFGNEKTGESQATPNSGTQREIPYVAETDDADMSIDYS